MRIHVRIQPNTHKRIRLQAHIHLHIHNKLICLCLCSAPNVKVMQSQQAWVNGGRGHDSLKLASALIFNVMEIQTRVAPAELWLRDDLENIYALPFWFLGFGFRLAMSNVGWHVTQKFVILVPDLIFFAPWPVLLDPGEPCNICQYTSFRPLIAGLFLYTKEQRRHGRWRSHGSTVAQPLRLY